MSSNYKDGLCPKIRTNLFNVSNPNSNQRERFNKYLVLR